MTVRELIAELEKIEDKDIMIAVWENNKWTSRIDGVHPEEIKRWNESGDEVVTRINLDFLTY